MQRFKPHIVHLLIVTLIATILALPTNAKDVPVKSKVIPFHLDMTDPSAPDVIQLAPGHPNSIEHPIQTKPRCPGCLPHIAFTYSHSRYFGIFIESWGCCALRANVIVYRKYTTIASVLWWGPCYNPKALLQWPCIYMLQGGLDQLHSILSQGEAQIPVDQKYCYQGVCIHIKARQLWHDAVYHRDDDLTEAMLNADQPPGLYGLGEHHYCLTLSVSASLNVNWTYRKKSVDGCKAGY